jgi:hypothetical protein
VRDSCGSSGTGETPQAQCAEEAHRPPRGMVHPGAEINHYSLFVELQQSLRKSSSTKAISLAGNMHVCRIIWRKYY